MAKNTNRSRLHHGCTGTPVWVGTLCSCLRRGGARPRHLCVTPPPTARLRTHTRNDQPKPERQGQREENGGDNVKLARGGAFVEKKFSVSAEC